MEDSFADPVKFSKGFNLRDLLSSSSEFQIDVDYNKRKNLESFLNEGDICSDLENSEDSDAEDVLKSIEESTNQLMLSSPEYHSFEELSAKMISCTNGREVQMLIIEEGSGPLVPVDAEVTLHYAAYWEKASIPFDSTLTMNGGSPVRLRVDKVLPGIGLGLTMVKGPTARLLLLLEPSVMWGPKGVLPRIKPERALFVITLYDVRDVHAAIRFNDLPTAEQSKFEVTMNTVKSLNGHAKDLYQKKRYSKAIKDYQQVIYVLRLSKPSTEDEAAEIKKLKIKVYLNLAVCYYKTDKPKYVLEMLNVLDDIIDINTNCKALFYYGRANESLGKTDEAIKYYKKALELEPKNKEIGQALCELDEYIKKSSKNEKEMWKSAFSTTSDKKEERSHDVDEDFRTCVREMCEDLANRTEYARFDVPNGYSKKELDYVKDLVKEFNGIVLDEDGEGKKKKVSIVKRMVH